MHLKYLRGKFSISCIRVYLAVLRFLSSKRVEGNHEACFVKIMDTFRTRPISKELESVSKYHILNRPDRVAQLAEHWASIPKVVGSIPTVVRHIFQLSQSGYTLN